MNVSSVRIGTSTNFTNLMSKLAPFDVNDWAQDLIGSKAFPLAQTSEYVPISVSTVFELTGKDLATTTEVLDAIQLNGALLIAEVGPALRLKYKNQPKDEELIVAHKPITIPKTDSRVYLFYVVNENGKLCLRAHGAYPTCRWHGSQKFVHRTHSMVS